MKDHVVEKKYQVKRPEEEEGADMDAGTVDVLN